MKIKDVLAKDPTEWTDEERAFAKSYREVDPEAAIKDRLARANKAHEAEKARMKAELDEAKEARELAEAGSEKETMQKKLDRLQAKFEEQGKMLEAERDQRAKVSREAALSSVQIPWLDSVSSRYRQSVLEEAFDGIDTEDISSESEKVIGKIMESQKDFIRAETKKGAGSQGKEEELKTDGYTAEKLQEIASSGKALPQNEFQEAFAAAGKV